MFQLSERLSPSCALQSTCAGAIALTLRRVALVRECARRYVEYHAHAERKIRAAAFIGVFGFPIFYLVWTYVLPQPYESILLRAIGTGLCLLLALRHVVAARGAPLRSRRSRTSRSSTACRSSSR